MNAVTWTLIVFFSNGIDDSAAKFTSSGWQSERLCMMREAQVYVETTKPESIVSSECRKEQGA